MAELLKDITPKMGRVIPVKNIKPIGNAAKQYSCIKIEDNNGRNERYLLITPTEGSNYRIVDVGELSRYTLFKDFSNNRDKLDAMKAGRLYPVLKHFKNGNTRPVTLIKLKYFIEREIYKTHLDDTDGYDVVIELPTRVLKRAEYRATRNPEDLALVGFWRNLID